MRSKQPGESRTVKQSSSSTAYAQAQKAWDRGDSDTTLTILEALPTSRQSAESLLLLARALISRHRHNDARKWLAKSVSRHRTPNNHATQLVLQAVIQAREGYPAEAEALFNEALALKAHHSVKAEIHYERALVQYSAECYDDSRASLRLVPPHSGIAYVRAIELEGWLDSAAKNYRSAQAAFVRALAALDECEVLDMSLRASLVHVLSVTMAEFDSDNVDRLIKEAGRVSWTHNLVREQVQTLRHIGLVHRRSGREDDAMRLFGEASSIEPGSPWQVIGLAECAWLCVDRDDSVGASGYVAAAQCLVDQITWATVLAEQRVALLVLAQAVARLGDGVAAGRLVELFCLAPQTAMRDFVAQYHNDWLPTYMQHTAGLVQAACGETGTARASLSAAHRAWSQMGYHWQALDALAGLKRIDSRRMPDEVWDRAGDRHRQILFAGPPAKPFSGQISGAALRERFARRYNIKSWRLADILQLAFRGRNNKQIGEEHLLTERTIKNKMGELYRIVGVSGVTSRSDLIARCVADEGASGDGF